MEHKERNGYNPKPGKSTEAWLDIPKDSRTGQWNVNWRLLGLRIIAYSFPVLSMNIMAEVSTRLLIGNMLAIIGAVVHNYLTNAGNGKNGNDGHNLSIKQ